LLPFELALDPFDRGVLWRRLAAFGLAPLPEADAFVERACADRAPLFAELARDLAELDRDFADVDRDFAEPELAFALDRGRAEPDFAFVELDCFVLREFVFAAISHLLPTRIPSKATTPVYTQ
jgi:hypothetical protein